jgi:hypothetical protein
VEAAAEAVAEAAEAVAEAAETIAEAAVLEAEIPPPVPNPETTLILERLENLSIRFSELEAMVTEEIEPEPEPITEEVIVPIPTEPEKRKHSWVQTMFFGEGD